MTDVPIPQADFEMQRWRNRRLVESVWIPLRASASNSSGKVGYVGNVSDFFGVGSVAISVSHRGVAETLSWSDIGLIREQRSFAFENSYKPADVYQRSDENDLGIDLVLSQSFDGVEPRMWHLNQDIVIALGLLREGDTWICPAENYIDVVRLLRNEDGTPRLVEMRTEWLRDYLSARRMVLRVCQYKSLSAVVDNASHITWPEHRVTDVVNDTRFEGRVSPIHEGGEPLGITAAIFHVSRTDIDPETDVPIMGASNDKNTAHKSWTMKSAGRTLYRIEGEVWKDETIEPAQYSPRVRRDDVPSSTSFIVDASGAKMSADSLNDEDIGRWLWFASGVIRAVSERRGGTLRWYTLETGLVESSVGYGVHFGLNSENLVTVYAYDIAKLPEWQRRLWAGFNVSPEGGVSQELLQAQAEARPARTRAPETRFRDSLLDLDSKATKRWGSALFRDHHDAANIIEGIHRFRASDKAGLLSLAKDLARVTADRIDTDMLRSVLHLEKGENKKGSLKLLESALSIIVADSEARKLLTTLVGIYELRLGDAHLPSSKINEAYALAGVDPKLPWLTQGRQLIAAAADALERITDTIEPQD